jgi:hypothetical protein
LRSLAVLIVPHRQNYQENKSQAAHDQYENGDVRENPYVLAENQDQI